MQTLDPKQFESALTQLFTHQLGLPGDNLEIIDGLCIHARTRTVPGPCIV